MVLHPNAQSAAQAELDRVIGYSRLPDIGDKYMLPYVTALVKEVMRQDLLLSLRYIDSVAKYQLI
jgi:hypothetical protein